MRDNLIKTACIVGLLAWSSATFAKETSTSIIEVGEPAPRLMPRFQSTSSDITFENQGETLVGTLTEPLMTGPYPIVLLLQGLTVHRNSFLVQGTKEVMYERTARVFAEHGIASLRIDFRGSGESDGEVSDRTFSSEISDTLAAIEYAVNLPQIDPERMGLLGLSQGGLVAASTAAKDDRIDSAVLWSPVANPYASYSIDIFGPDRIKAGLNLEDGEILPYTAPSGRILDRKRPFFEDLLKIDPVAEITRFTDPLLVIVGLQDTIIAPQPEMGEIYVRYHEGEEALVKLDADHIFSVSKQSAELDKAIAWSLDWFTKTLKKRPEKPEETEKSPPSVEKFPPVGKFPPWDWGIWKHNW